jgi:ParB family chromosome partitioning protein
MENNLESSNKRRVLGRGLGSLLGSDSLKAEENTANDHRRASSAEPAALSSQKLNSHRDQFVSRSAHPNPGESNPMKSEESHSPSARRTVPVIPDHARIWNIPIEKIVPGAHQPRKAFEKAQLEELAQSIREHGVLQPLLVRKKSDGRYELIAGERRWRAAQLAGLLDLPAIIKNFEDRQSAEVALIENIQRQDLNPVEEAQAMRRLLADFGLTQQELAARIGKERATIANSLRLLSLPQVILDMVSQQIISSGHAKVLLSLEDQKAQVELAEQVRERKLSVRQLEGLVKKAKKYNSQIISEADSDQSSSEISARLAASLAEELQKRLGTKVQIDYAKGKGKVILHFFSDEELTRFFEKLK